MDALKKKVVDLEVEVAKTSHKITPLLIIA